MAKITLFESLELRKDGIQVLNKVTGGKPRATRRSSGGRRVILKALQLRGITYIETWTVT
jgi:hypothetical protein